MTYATANKDPCDYSDATLQLTVFELKNDDDKKQKQDSGQQFDRQEWIARAVAAAAMNPAKRNPAAGKNPPKKD